MNAPIEMIRLSRRISRAIPMWTQGFGGNISSKDGDAIAIKASGRRLDEVTATEGWVGLRLSPLRKELESLARENPDSEASERRYSSILKKGARVLEGTGTPSMETGFHAFLPRTYVLHFHSLAALLMAHARKTKDSSRWFDSHWRDGSIRFLGPIQPGWQLSREIRRDPSPTVFIVENHGVILHADSPDILDRWASFERSFCESHGYSRFSDIAHSSEPLAAARTWMEAATSTPMRIYFPDTAVFLDRLVSGLKREGDGYRATESLWQSDRGAAELWLATSILYRVCPDLGEMPKAISDSTASLPVERIRRAAIDRRDPADE